MYNYSGLMYRICGVCGIIFLLGIICILFQTLWTKEFKIRDCKVGLAAVVFAICLTIVYASRIVFPGVSSYAGKFIDSHRNSQVAPPLPLTNEYIFWSGQGKKKVFYLDVLSKKEIFPYEFEEGKDYTIYFDDFTHVIVRVEGVE